MKKRTRRSKGQIAVVFALALPALLGALALCTDVGVMYLNWEYLQKAADAAVLAGANRGLPYNADLATQVARQYARLNGVKSDEIVSTKVSGDHMSISMKLSREVPYLFGKALGLTQARVTVAATAGLKPASAACGFLPIGIPCNASGPVSSVADCSNASYNTWENGGSQVTLKPAPNNGPSVMQGPGNWEPLALGGAGGKAYENNIIYGYSGPPLGVGTTVATETGQIVGPTALGFQQRMQNAGQSGFVSNPPEDDELDAANAQIMLVPLIAYANVNGKSVVQILGFQEMWVSGVNGNTAAITGYFINKLPACGTPTVAASGSINAFKAVLTN